jgi:hypothetical protein
MELLESNATKSKLTVVDLLGIIPVAGVVFDATNCIVYLLEGDIGSAAYGAITVTVKK